jgi:hypothetical protein
MAKKSKESTWNPEPNSLKGWDLKVVGAVGFEPTTSTV